MLPVTRRPAWWLLAPAIGLVVLYVQQYVPSLQIIAQREAAVAASALLLILSASLVSTTAALEVGRDRASCGMTEVSVRSKIEVVAARLWPCLVAGTIVQMSGIFVLLDKAGSAPDRFPVLITVGLLCSLLFHAGIGVFLGTWLRPRFAVPFALALSYLWLGFAWSFDFVPVRYLAGLALEGCCSPSETVDISAVVALIVFSLAGFVGLVLMAGGVDSRKLRPRGNRNWLRLVAGIATLGLGTSLGLFAARDVGVNPVVARPLADAQCSNSVPEVCLFSTQLARGDTRHVYADTFTVLAARGMPKVTQVFSISGDHESVLSAQGVANVVAAPGQSRSAALESAASTFAVAASNTECGDDVSTDIYGWSEVLKVWSVQAAALQILDSEEREGIPDTSFLELISEPGETDFAQQWQVLSGFDEQSQNDWAASTYRQLSQCQVPAQLGVGPR